MKNFDKKDTLTSQKKNIVSLLLGFIPNTKKLNESKNIKTLL